MGRGIHKFQRFGQVLPDFHEGKLPAMSKMGIQDAIADAEQDVADFGFDDSYMDLYGPNWGDDYDALGEGQHSAWDPGYSSWTTCENGPENF